MNAYFETKAQISCIVTVFAKWIVQSHYLLNLKFSASSHLLSLHCIVSDLVRNPKDRFSQRMAHM